MTTTPDPWPACIFLQNDVAVIEEFGVHCTTWDVAKVHPGDVEYVRVKPSGSAPDANANLPNFKRWAMTEQGKCNPHDLRENPLDCHERLVEGETFVSSLVERDWTVWQAARADARTDAKALCECSRCLKESGATVEILPGHFVPLSGVRMVLCASCENKRCPRAADHRNDCTDSNEPGQPGSNYAHLAAPDAEVLWEAIRGVRTCRQLRDAAQAAGEHDHVSNEHYMAQEIDSLRGTLLLALAFLKANVATGNTCADHSAISGRFLPVEITGRMTEAGDEITSGKWEWNQLWSALLEAAPYSPVENRPFLATPTKTVASVEPHFDRRTELLGNQDAS